ncbi:hypothetical protein Tco_0213128 [Tanacetum coccineum]
MAEKNSIMNLSWATSDVSWLLGLGFWYKVDANFIVKTGVEKRDNFSLLSFDPILNVVRRSSIVSFPLRSLLLDSDSQYSNLITRCEFDLMSSAAGCLSRFLDALDSYVILRDSTFSGGGEDEEYKGGIDYGKMFVGRVGDVEADSLVSNVSVFSS